MKHRRMMQLFSIVMSALIATTVFGQTLKAPQSVKTGLRIMNQVVGHTGRLIASKNYEQVPREGGEFTDGVAVLREGIANEPAAFKSKVEPLIAKATQASAALSDASKAGNEAALGKAHDQFTDAVNAVIGAFPEDLRPKTRPATPAPQAPSGS